MIDKIGGSWPTWWTDTCYLATEEHGRTRKYKRRIFAYSDSKFPLREWRTDIFYLATEEHGRTRKNTEITEKYKRRIFAYSDREFPLLELLIDSARDSMLFRMIEIYS